MNQHTMYIVRRYPAGEEEWRCRECDHRLLITWRPLPSRRVLELGDTTATHTGCAPGAPAPSEAERLAPWAEALEEIGFDRLWGRAT